MLQSTLIIYNFYMSKVCFQVFTVQYVVASIYSTVAHNSKCLCFLSDGAKCVMHCKVDTLRPAPYQDRST